MTLEPDDLARLYETHAAGVLRFFARRTLQADVAIDLVAETFARAFANRAQFRGRSEGEALAWVFGIARHELSAYFRRGVVERRALAKIGLSVGPLIDADYERVEELADLRALRLTVSDALAHLTVEHREALRLRVVEEQPYPEIARTLGVSETTVRARVSRALRALSKATASLEGSPEHA
ncbi:MAG TPA: RNA polymerase sigma factor [Solirubrobacteraceae bacterium]|nr:RNA polymerase sigma factor [Solirubrobacteraceae bacterium]